jgi:uncharacterized protein YunC (DUF1805 family)
MRAIVTAESVTALGPEVRGAVLVAGSHGGRIAGTYAAKAGAHAVILNDAGVGKDGAGIAALDALETIGMAAATAAHSSARIGDGMDMLARGRISHANAQARRCGVAAGMPVRDASVRLCTAPAPHSAPPDYTEGRTRLADGPPEVWGLDSLGLLLGEDAGRILIIGSHGALHGGRPESALGVAARAAVFNDAGIGADGAGLTRLPVLDARAIAAATVGCMSARIGDCRSMWDTGRISAINAVAQAAGARQGQSMADFVACVRERSD